MTDKRAIAGRTPPAANAARPLHVAIIGAGIAGLGAAYQLKHIAQASEQDITYAVYESDGRIGGQLWTDRPTLPCGRTAIADGGSDSYLSSKHAAMARVARLLGIEDQLIGTDDSTKQTFIVKGGALVPLPDGIMLFAPTKVLPLITTKLYSWPAKFRMAADVVLPRKKLAPNEDESIGSLVRRRLGRECLDRLAEPLVGGINGSDPKTMSTRAVYPMLLAMEQQYGSLIRGFLAQRKKAEAARAASSGTVSRTFFSSCRKGLDDFTNALAAAIGEQHVHTSTPVTAIKRTAEGRYQLSIRREAATGIVRHSGIICDYASCADAAEGLSEVLYADAVIITAPAWVAGELLADLTPPAAEILSDIPHSSCATIITAFDSADAPFARNWHGILAPGIEDQKVTGISLMSSKWSGRAPADSVLLRGFVGGARDSATPYLPDDELIELARSTYVTLLGLQPQAQPTYAKVFRFPRAMPQYIVGHLQRMDVLNQHLAQQKGLALGGAAYTGVGVPNCLESGERAALKVLADLNIVLPKEQTPQKQAR
ncbi:MAG: protoporphyrinogen oxidase [Coriobacteriia bacterium]|nr:protoporphyrinogen oxidase [Coriobacteriia bacterium]